MFFALLSALWLGILTSLSPCPLATNIAAISFISKNIQNPKRTVLAGILYTLGRTITYLLLGAVVASGLLAIPAIANFLQTYMNLIIAPLLVLVGLVLLGIIKLNFSCGLHATDICKKVNASSAVGAILLGVIFALSLCPISAALFFGSLTGLALETQSVFLVPFMFGIGTGLPVALFAIVIAFAVNKVGRIYDSIAKFEIWFRKITGGIFIIAGVYFFLSHYVF